MFSEVVDAVGRLDDAGLDVRLRDLEGERRELAAKQAAVLAEMDRRRTYARDGHASIWGQLRVSVHWSDGENRDGMRLARLLDRYPFVGDALLEHRISVAHAGELARAASNPRIGDRLDEVIGAFSRLAERIEYDDFRTAVRGWEQRTDRRESEQQAAEAHEQRRADWHADGLGGQLIARFGPVDGIAAREILDRYERTEWLADWDATVAIHGDDASSVLMPRTAEQRRADALSKALADAASREPGSKAPEPVVNVHLDHATFVDLMVEAELFPERDVDPFDDPTPHVRERMCRTEHGDPLDPRTVLQLLLEGHVRWVIRNDRGIPIRWGRKQRLFKGAARDAVRSLSTRCTHPGCRARTRHTETDHLRPWLAGGLTDPDNGGPVCRRHHQQRTSGGLTTHRDALGFWHTLRPDGSEIT